MQECRVFLSEDLKHSVCERARVEIHPDEDSWWNLEIQSAGFESGIPQRPLVVLPLCYECMYKVLGACIRSKAVELPTDAAESPTDAVESRVRIPWIKSPDFIMSVCLSVCLSVFLSIGISVCLSVCLPVYLFVCLSTCLSVCLSVCLSSFPVSMVCVERTCTCNNVSLCRIYTCMCTYVSLCRIYTCMCTYVSLCRIYICMRTYEW